MKKDRYVVFDNKMDAKEFIRDIDQIIGEHWADPLVNPFNGKAIVPWNDDYLKKARHLLKGEKILSPHEAEHGGWYFGYHQGCFAKASTKYEDALFAREALDMFDHYPNFPAYRATFYGVLVSIFGIKEALRYACEKYGNDAWAWWSIKFKEIERDQLLKLFIDLHNEDKHKLYLKYLRPTMKLYSFKSQTAVPNIISGEGAFSIVNHGTKYERRVFLKGAEAEFSCYLNIKSIMHQGKEVGSLTIKEQIDLVLDYYRDIIWEAKVNFKTKYL